MLTQEEMNQRVPEKLREIEQIHDVTVLWAVESGSRAWGFESTDSDFDVRFIYKRNQAHYLRLNPGRDVIELPIDEMWDVSGWDLDKTLKLLLKSNPTLFEWIQSPIVYHQTEFIDRFRELARQYFSEKKMLYHYLSMAKNHVRLYLTDEKIKPKKYFYALRPILACLWMQKYHTVPPILFNDLVEAMLPQALHHHVSELLQIKMNAPEDTTISPIMPLHEYLETTIDEIEQYANSIRGERPSWEPLNQFFVEEITCNRVKCIE